MSGACTVSDLDWLVVGGTFALLCIVFSVGVVIDIIRSKRRHDALVDSWPLYIGSTDRVQL